MRKIHIAQGVENIDEAIDFYNKIFYDIQPNIGSVELGTGRKVRGAEWRSKYIYLVVFEGHEKSIKHGIDHLGIIFDDKNDLDKCAKFILLSILSGVLTMVFTLFSIVWLAIGIQWTINVANVLERKAMKNVDLHGYNYKALLTWYWVANVIMWPASFVSYKVYAHIKSRKSD